MIPAVPLLFTLGGISNGIYAVGKAYDNYRYWSDYYRNTGYRPRYPWRAGMYDWLRDSGRTFNNVGLFYSKW